jgi:hypothetical protein
MPFSFPMFIKPNRLVGLRFNSTLKFLPNLQGVNGNTTLGEVYNRVYGKYRYRLVWPILGWIGFLYYNLWFPYDSDAVKAKALERMEKLKSLEFVQKE